MGENYAADWIALGLTLKLALVTTVVLLLLGTPLALWLARSRWRFRFLVEALVALPLILPPTVLGFYLLLAVSPQGWIGSIWNSIGGAPLAFSFEGLVLGSVIYSLPFVVQPIQSAIQSVNEDLLEAAATLRATPWQRFRRVILPLAWPGFLTAIILGFAHTLGEFGVVLMIGGNIPAETRVVSIAIYDHVESMDYAHAHFLSAVLLGTSFLMLVAVYALNGRFRPWKFSQNRSHA
jgi:molybdate transport system permease protein